MESTHTGIARAFYPETGSPTGEDRKVFIRETKKFWIEKSGYRFSKDGGWPKRGHCWRLDLATVAMIVPEKDERRQPQG